MSVDPEIIERVKTAKARRQASTLQYRDRSRLAFVVHSFNRLSNVEQLASGLRRMGEHELIVCDDGSLDGSREAWMRHLERPNDFLILSNDVHEIRILDRAIRFACAEIVCLVQDDDSLPPDDAWLKEALWHFEAHPKLAILGGFMGFDGFEEDPRRSRDSAVWGDEPFRFVGHVNIGPYFLRKRHYEDLGGWDFSLSGAGEPGICFDSELCLRAWLHGLQVGYRFVPFKGPPKHYSLDGGTMLFSKEVRFRNQWRNHGTISARYAGHARAIAERVDAANRGLGPARSGG